MVDHAPLEEDGVPSCEMVELDLHNHPKSVGLLVQRRGEEEVDDVDDA